MKIYLLICVIISLFLLSSCVFEQLPQGTDKILYETSFHPILYTSPGTIGGVNKSQYTITDING